eukprot:6151013-Karenia_brevis.AAC.1
MEEVFRRLQGIGSYPQACYASDWTAFGHKLAQDISLPALTHNKFWLKKEIKSMGGLAAIWRNMFPDEAMALTYRFGYPSRGYRSL